MTTLIAAGIAALLLAGAIPGAAQNAPAQEPYKIGATFPLTGSLVLPEILAGAQVAVAEINQHGGVKGHPLELDVEDSQATPQGGVSAFRKLAEVNRVVGIYTIYTNVVTAEIPLADQLRVPFISQIENRGLMRGRYSFNHSPNAGMSIPLLQRYWKAKHVKRLYALLGDNAFGHAIAPLVKAAADSIGAEYGESFVSLDETDFRGSIDRARTFRPEALLVQAQGSTAETSMIREVRELGMSVQMYLVSNNYDQKTWRDAVGPYAEGLIMGGSVVDPQAGRTFIHEYKERMGYVPGYAAGEGYDIVHLFAVAIARSSYSGDAVRTALETVKGVPSVFGGTITMGPDHYTQLSVPPSLLEVRRGKVVRISPDGG